MNQNQLPQENEQAFFLTENVEAQKTDEYEEHQDGEMVEPVIEDVGMGEQVQQIEQHIEEDPREDMFDQDFGKMKMEVFKQ